MAGPGRPGHTPVLGTAADARPGKCVIADLDHAFAQVQHEDGDAPSRWNVVFTAAGGSGKPRRHLARFVWGLLQTVTALEHPRPWPRNGSGYRSCSTDKMLPAGSLNQAM